ncbi:MAG: OprO/OprP family phosphate-selective porin [Bacteroidia bacterium]|nr:OprO/OprP family phosphate-selective porin [Bacteroidia bacterium]
MTTFRFIFAITFFLATTHVFSQNTGTSVGGYGEVHYNEPEGSRKGTVDMHRFVIYLNHQFNDWIGFFSETEIEHTWFSSSGGPGELGIEQAFLEFTPWKKFGIRAGILLPPVGIINQVHEPNTFHGVERPSFHRVIIPTTWREAGVGVFSSPIDGLHVQLYTVSSFKGDGLNASNGLRGGRWKAAEASTADMGFTGRVDVLPLAGLSLGASFFTGGLTGGDEALGDASTSILAGDVRYSIGGLELRGEAAMISVTDADKLNAAFNKQVADKMNGFYIEAAYDFLRHLAETEQQLFVFGRYEAYNTQAETTGFEALRQYDRNDTTIGLTYKPDPAVAVKLDYQMFDHAAADKATGQLNIGIGYAFF